jgi:O-antigen/teichoic acid export membrane protein
MALTIAMRWMCGLYRGAVSGSERLVWLSAFNSSIATLRFIGAVPLLMFVGTTPTIFFSFQFGVALVEIVALLWYAYRLLPAIPHGQRLAWNWLPLKPVLKFSLTLAFTSSVWVIVTQTDKLVLSKILPLAEYGNFTLAVLVASGVTIINGPISSAIMPRMAKLEAEGDHVSLIAIYRQATQLAAVTAGAAAITAAFCAEPLLWAWTGDRQLAQQAAPILPLYAIGNGVLAVSAFPYYLQFAKGDLRLHLIGNAAFAVLLIPLIVWGVSRYGVVGAGYAWLYINLLSFVAWLPWVHRKFEPGLNAKWYGEDTTVIFVAMLIAGYGASHVVPHSDNRAFQFVAVMAYGLVVMLAGGVASSSLRNRVKLFLN